ncbi:AI-2E family transporter [Methylobacter sp.]|uniref:AI-2E family transporter n=2 Tax=unclassified Methylobacter TaxID=2635283 RepID=UPI003DA5EDB0
MDEGKGRTTVMEDAAMSFWDRGRMPESGGADMDRFGARSISGLLTKRTLIVAAAAAAIVVLLLMVWQVAQILLLIFASMLLALLLRSSAVVISENTALTVNASLILVVLIMTMGVALIGSLYGPDIATDFYQLTLQLPSTIDRMRDSLGQYEWAPAVLEAMARVGHALTNPQQLARIAGVFSTAFGALGSILIVIVLGLYFAVEPKTYIDGVARLFPQYHRGRVYEAFERIGSALRWWLLSRLVSMVAVGLLTVIGLVMLGMPLAFILALVAAIMDFVPHIGPILAIVPAVMVGLGQDGSTVLYVFILYTVIQGLESYLLTPYLQKQMTSIAPAWLLAAQLVLGTGFGILGFLLAPPLAVVIMVLVQMFYVRDVLGEKMELP